MKNTANAIAAIFLLAGPWRAVQAERADRLPAGIDNRVRVRLEGSRNPRVDKLKSDGPVENSMPVKGITLHFRPSPEQAAALDQFLEEQQDPAASLYRAWLTPKEFADRFGLGTDDFARVREWVESQGFHVEAAAQSRTWIKFSGTAGQVRYVLSADLHRFRDNGKIHFANVTDPSLPQDLAPLVATIRGLDDFGIERRPRPRPRARTSKGANALSPSDLAVIYNLSPLHQKGITGSGQKVAVVGMSEFKMSDIQGFRNRFSLPRNDPKMVLAPGSRNPGITDEAFESVLDIEWAGAAAPDATILYVYAEDVDDALVYAVDENLAPVLTYSYGACESEVARYRGAVDTFRMLARQASAQGITWVAGSGDSGPSSCEPHGEATAGRSLAVDFPASIPEVTAVGGTTFNEGSGIYWNSAEGRGGVTARSYIPETTWNDTAAEKALAATGGGPSAVYPRPVWQAGPGVPADNARHVPDIALAASWRHDPYLLYFDGEGWLAGGTSASAPFFAGALALLNQQMVSSGAQSKPGLGNINPRLYQLAQSAPAVFHDITSGDNIVPCAAEVSGCTEGSWGYQAGPGYDHATGLGSIDMQNLVDKWASAKSVSGASLVVASVEPSPVYEHAPDADGYSWYFTVRVSETGGEATTLTGFSIDGNDFTKYITEWFGRTKLPAYGTLSAGIRTRDLTVPSDHVFAFTGIDASGQRWTREVSAKFLGKRPDGVPRAISWQASTTIPLPATR